MNAKIESEDLMNELFDFSEKMLKEYGEFHPFGGYLNGAKQVVHVGVDATNLIGMSDKDRFDLLMDEFKSISNSGMGIAFGLVTNVLLPEDGNKKQDAIKVFVEHEDGYCADVFFTYNLLPQKNVEIIDTFAQAGTSVFFEKR